MSRRRWNSVEDRRKLQKIDHVFQQVVEQAHAHQISLRTATIYDFDNAMMIMKMCIYRRFVPSPIWQ